MVRFLILLIVTVYLSGCVTSSRIVKGNPLAPEVQNKAVQPMELTFTRLVPNYSADPPRIDIQVKGGIITTWQERTVTEEMKELTRRSYDSIEPFPLTNGAWDDGDGDHFLGKMGVWPIPVPFGEGTMSPVFPYTFSVEFVVGALGTAIYPANLISALVAAGIADDDVPPEIFIKSPAFIACPVVDIVAHVGDLFIMTGDAVHPSDTSTEKKKTGKVLYGEWKEKKSEAPIDYSHYIATLTYELREATGTIDSQGRASIPIDDFDASVMPSGRAPFKLTIRPAADYEKIVAQREISIDGRKLAAAISSRPRIDSSTIAARPPRIRITSPRKDRFESRGTSFILEGSLASFDGIVSRFQVTVNDIPLIDRPSPIGGELVNFRETIFIEQGLQNEVVISAWDSHGRQSMKSLTVTAGQPADRYWALVIGISNYENNSIGGLGYADKDAEDIAKVLIKNGWREDRINLLTNEQATLRNIRIALGKWLTQAGPNDTIALFWAGHGFPDPQDPEKIYFACYDTDPEIPVTGYRMDEVVGQVKEIESHNVLILADACHAGKLVTRGDEERAVGRVVYEALSQQEALPPGWIFMVAADTDRKALESSDWRNGAFTKTLLEALDGNADGSGETGVADGLITAGEIRHYLKTQMPSTTLQAFGKALHPVIHTSTGDPDIWNLPITN